MLSRCLAVINTIFSGVQVDPLSLKNTDQSIKGLSKSQ